MIICELCQETLAEVKITYGLYQAFAVGRPHHVLNLCSTCGRILWEGDKYSFLKKLVAVGLSHFVAEKLA